MSDTHAGRMQPFLSGADPGMGADLEDDDFLIPPHENELAEAISSTAYELAPGTRIDRYEIIELIAHGGMGAVYRARRADDAYDKQVAIKIIRAGVASAHTRQRFHCERQALAQLDHPNISRLHDGGETPGGLPYLVMEYIKGQPIDQYCEEAGLSIAERLELFRAACDAVQYAHRNLIVHRDLKPGNILVTDNGEVKLVDFGIARLLEDEQHAEARLTVTRCRAMTPAYASPEQIRGEAVTTSADVYALGVVLYELLCGRRPYDLDDLPQYDAERIVCETPPPPPSTSVGRAVALVGAATDTRASLRRALSGDLDTIVLMALRKDPARRYGSVEQFSEDIRRHLVGLPVIARKDTLAYRAAKFTQRNRPQVIGGAIAIVALIAALVGISLGLVQAHDAQRAAQRERNIAVAARGEAQEVLRFYQDMLATANPYRSGGPVSVLDLLAEAERRIDAELADKPEVEAGVRLAMAHNYASLMMWERVLANGERSLALYRARRDSNDPVLAECLTLLGRGYVQRQRPGAINMQREALAIRRNAFGDDHPLLAETIGCLGYALWSAAEGRQQWSAAEHRYLEALEMLDRLGESEGRIAARLTMSLGFMYQHSDRPEDAEVRYCQALEKYAGLPVTEDMYELATMSLYSRLLEQSERLEASMAMLERCRSMIPADFHNERLVGAAWRMANLKRALGDRDGARAECMEAVALECEVYADRSGSDADQLRAIAAACRRPEAKTDFVSLAERAAAAIKRPDIARRAAAIAEQLEG